jgi:hypothetical protein
MRWDRAEPWNVAGVPLEPASSPGTPFSSASSTSPPATTIGSTVPQLGLSKSAGISLVRFFDRDRTLWRTTSSSSLGELFSVSPYIAKRLHNLFVLNERVALLGRWKYGFFSMVPVGATNVGSIKVNFDTVRCSLHLPPLTISRIHSRSSFYRISEPTNMEGFHPQGPTVKQFTPVLLLSSMASP